MNTKFSTAIHALVLISEAKVPLSSEEIAESVGTNSSYIRKVLGYLKKAGFITSRQGVSGFNLQVRPTDLNLYQIYQAVEDNPFFDIHQNPSDKCLVGRHIKKTLNNVLGDVEGAIKVEMESQSLADLIKDMKEELTQKEKEEYGYL